MQEEAFTLGGQVATRNKVKLLNLPATLKLPKLMERGFCPGEPRAMSTSEKEAGLRSKDPKSRSR